MEKINKEFDEFFELCKTVTKDRKQLDEVLHPLKLALWRIQMIKYAKLIATLTICFCAIYYCDTLNWYFCAIGRILMIKLLPLWNWRYLATAKCLIPRAQISETTPSGPSNFLSIKDCHACEFFEKIDVLKATNYNEMYEKFLIRGLPVIVSDAIADADQTSCLRKFIENISENMSTMIMTRPCNLDTNLMMSKYASLDESFNIIRNKLKESDEAPWFLSFRNCRFQAVKSSRLIAAKPYFYPKSMQAPYTSWLLISQNYEHYQSRLEFYGMAIITQLHGIIRIHLKVKEKCVGLCRDHSFDLHTGESLVLLPDLWQISYEFSSPNNFSVTFITESIFT